MPDAVGRELTGLRLLLLLLSASRMAAETPGRRQPAAARNFSAPTAAWTRAPSRDPMLVYRLVFAALYGVLFLLGLSNVPVLFIVSRYRRMRTVTNIFIFNLCVADLIYTAFLPVVIMFQLLRDWIFGEVICRLFYIAESTAKYASVYFVGVLSLDRYFALCHPHVCKRYRQLNLAVAVSAIGWVVTAVLMTPIYLFSAVVEADGNYMCTVRWPSGGGEGRPTPESASPDALNQSLWRNSSLATAVLLNETGLAEQSGNFSIEPRDAPSLQFYFIMFTFVFCFGLPALMIMFFYVRVLEQLIQASSRAERLKKKREKTYRKVTRMVLAVITFYVICWAPYWVQFLVVTFSNVSMSPALKIFFICIHLLPYLNCAVNPILYGLMTDNFRRILAELFPCFSLIGRCLSPPGQPAYLANGRQLRQRRSSSPAAAENDAEICYVRSSISQSIRLVSEFSINLLTSRLENASSSCGAGETTL